MTNSLNIPADTPLKAQRRAVIVGASAGLGAAIARELARDGWVLALLARREELLAGLCDEINQAAGETRAVAYHHDVTEFEAVPALFQAIHQDLKRIDLLVYNAGVMPFVGMDEYNFEKDRAMTEVQMLGGMAWLGQAATLFGRMGGGHIVGISSVAGDRGRVKNPGYNASKAGFDTYLEALRNRLTRKGVHVMTVRPGPMVTDMTKEVGGPMMVPPEQVAADIVRALRKRRQVLYTPRRWRLIMQVVIHMPSVIFRRLNF